MLDPDEANNGHSGSWYCFACGSKGTYTMDFQQTGDAPTDPDPVASTDAPADPAVGDPTVSP